MVKGPEDIRTIEAIKTLTAGKKAQKSKMFGVLAKTLKAPRRARPSVNLDKISRFSQPKAVVVVAGKVLGAGKLSHPVDIVALAFSEQAMKKIEDAGGAARDFKWLVEKGSKGVVLLK